MYGYWLPNDPRGSWSDFVGRWELVQFGHPRRTLSRKLLSELTPREVAARNAAQRALVYPAVTLTDDQKESIAEGFATLVKKKWVYNLGLCDHAPTHSFSDRSPSLQG